MGASKHLNQVFQVLPQDLNPQGYFEYEFVDRSHCQVTQVMCCI